MSDAVTILLAVHNGGRFLGEQLLSLERQTYGPIDIIASDDGSKDGSADVLAAARRNWRKGSFDIVSGPCGGFAENFRSLIVMCESRSGYAAFSDQDDIWDDVKLAKAVDWLSAQDPAVPALFCSRTRIVAVNGEPIGLSPLFSRPPSFRNAIVQSIAGGNTMVMNQAAMHLLARASRRASFVSHDWWAYQIVTGAGGVVHYSPEPLISYRQHDSNLVGSNNSAVARIARYRFLLRGGFHDWTKTNIDGLNACADLLTEEAAAVLLQFEQACAASLTKRLTYLARSGAYRQTARGDMGLYIAAAINKL